MNTGAAIMVVGGAAMWLWGVVTPGFSVNNVVPIVLGAALAGFGMMKLFS